MVNIKKIRQKLLENSGFSLSEQLLNILLLGALTLAIATGVVAAVSSHEKINTINNANVLLILAADSLCTELSYTSEVDKDLSSTVGPYFESQSVGYLAFLNNSQKGIDLVSGSTGVITNLVPSSANLKPVIQDLNYNRSTKVWDFTIKVCDISTGKTYVEQDLSVLRMGS